jgi:hypothetical protein
MLYLRLDIKGIGIRYGSISSRRSCVHMASIKVTELSSYYEPRFLKSRKEPPHAGPRVRRADGHV